MPHGSAWNRPFSYQYLIACIFISPWYTILLPWSAPHAGIVMDVEGVRHLAELGVVFLLFNIGLELSLDRLHSMQKFVFGLGGLQVPIDT